MCLLPDLRMRSVQSEEVRVKVREHKSERMLDGRQEEVDLEAKRALIWFRSCVCFVCSHIVASACG